MEKNRKRGLSHGERLDLWRRWKEGQSLSDIGRALGKAPASVYAFLAIKGGIAPAPRHRSRHALRLDQREEISRGLCSDRSLREIAKRIRKAPSTVSREVARNGGLRHYRAVAADSAAWANAIACIPSFRNHERLLERCAVIPLEVFYGGESCGAGVVHAEQQHAPNGAVPSFLLSAQRDLVAQEA